MKLLLDQNLPPSLVVGPADLFALSQHVYTLGLDRVSDLEIRDYLKLTVLATAAFGLCILVLASSAVARSQDPSATDGKVDQFGYVGAEEAMARLDAFARQLHSDPGVQGFIIGHNRSDLRRGWFLRQAYGYRDYLLNTRGIATSRVEVIEAETRQEIGFELWLLPIGTSPPVPAPAFPPEPKSPERFDEVWIGKESECVGELTIELYELKDALRFFGEALRQQPATKAWIVVHPRARESLTKATRTLNASKDSIVEGYGVNPARVLTATGGGRLSTCTVVNLWIVPSDSIKPDEAAYHSRLMDEAEKDQYTVRMAYFVGNEHIRDRTLRRRFLLQEGDIFKRSSLEKSLKSLSTLNVIYPVTLNDVEVNLEREDKLINFTIYFKERPRVRRASKFY